MTESSDDILFGLDHILNKAKRGRPGEHRFWDSRKSPENPMGEVLRLPDPPKLEGMPRVKEEDLWVDVQQPKSGQ